MVCESSLLHPVGNNNNNNNIIPVLTYTIVERLLHREYLMFRNVALRKDRSSVSQGG